MLYMHLTHRAGRACHPALTLHATHWHPAWSSAVSVPWCLAAVLTSVTKFYRLCSLLSADMATSFSRFSHLAPGAGRCSSGRMHSCLMVQTRHRMGPASSTAVEDRLRVPVCSHLHRLSSIWVQDHHRMVEGAAAEEAASRRAVSASSK